MGRRRANGIGFELRQLRKRIAVLEAALGITPPTVNDRINRPTTAEDREETTDESPDRGRR
jgi:hypothetical protein